MNLLLRDQRYPLTALDPAGFVTLDVLETMSISDIVAMTQRELARRGAVNGAIDRLFIAGHGNAGYVQFGTGLTASTSRLLAPLRPLMLAAAGRRPVEVHGCGVGSGTAITPPAHPGHPEDLAHPTCIPGNWAVGHGGGYPLLYGMAATLGAPVRAGINCQLADDAWAFEGQSIVVWPNGSATLLN